MASVTSLDKDMKNLRLSRYTPQAANEARSWIENTLGEKLPPGDLLEALKDGVALCKLANRAIQPQHGAIKFKASHMPFIQMENISHFLRACEMPPLSLPAHDRFLTVDLFEQKDPAQVLQCLGAFSRQAHNLSPAKFSTTIGPRKTGGVVTPSTTGNGAGFANGAAVRRPGSPVKPSAGLTPSWTGGSTGSNSGPKSPSGPVSSWSRKSDESSSAPAWNIHQYGYMGGASQGNQGINFGARRQIVNQAPAVPSLAEKEKVRREKEAELERQRHLEAEEQDRKRRQAEEDEANARIEEEKRWEQETRLQREEERKRLDDQKRQWEEQERRWKDEEEVRQKEDAVLKATLSKKAPEKPRVPSSSILRGQTLAEYQKEQATLASADVPPTETPEQKRVRELEQQLEEARERERQYQAEREERLRKEHGDESRPSTADTARPGSAHESEVSWVADEREYSRKQWQGGQASVNTQVGSQRPQPAQPQAQPSLPQRPLPEPVAKTIEERPSTLPTRSQQSFSSPFTRPLPTPQKSSEPYEPQQVKPNRTDQFLATAPAPASSGPRISSSQEAGDTSLEQQQLRDSRLASQQKTKAGGWASKSLLEREMERERERQKEWEANQQTIKDAPRDASQGSGEGQSWDIHTYGYMGGDSQNKGSGVGSGINFGGRRPIIGPRPQK